MKIQDLLLKFQGVKQVSENQYMAICPAHDDHSPSLSIGLSKDGKQVLLNCFAGCKAEDVLSNVGLKLKDLYDNDERNETNIMSQTVYTYYNADGSIAYATYIYREKAQSGLKSENTKQVALYLKGKTLFENSKKVKLYNRVGKAENAFWYDLRTEDWKFVKITEEGWEIREEDKILFTLMFI